MWNLLRIQVVLFKNRGFVRNPDALKFVVLFKAVIVVYVLVYHHLLLIYYNISNISV